MYRTTPPVVIYGVPTDIGCAHRGASMGPEALRVAGIVEKIARRGIEVEDAGNVSGPQNPLEGPVDGYRHLPEVTAWNRAAFDKSAEILAAGKVPVMMGGDHCLGIGAIAAVADHCRAQGKKLRVLWLDAHADFNTSEVSPSGNIHGMPVAVLCGIGPASLVEMGKTSPSITPDQVRQIGIRSVDRLEKQLVKQHALDIYDMRYIDEIGMRRVMDEALEGVDENTHLHVSFDVDMLDPSIAPGTGTRVPGGVNYREAQLMFEMLADTGRVGSVDIVEVNPALDKRNATARLAVALMESLFGKSTLVRD